MDRQEYATGAAVLAVSAALAFGLGTAFFSDDRPPKYSEVLNATVNGDEPIRKVSFDNQTIQLMFGDRAKARMYIDKDMDGSFDIELDGLTRDGEVHTATQTLTFGDTSYRLQFRYKDDEKVEGDAWLTLYQIQQI